MGKRDIKTDKSSLHSTGLPDREIQYLFGRIGAERVVTFLDCCHSESRRAGKESIRANPRGGSTMAVPTRDGFLC